jgi:hypothetical protein
MAAKTAADFPARFQWEDNSKPSQAENCGPTSMTFIANCYRPGVYMKIEATRQLIRGMGPYNIGPGWNVGGAPAGTPTSPAQQRDMLRKRGVPCEIRDIGSVDELHALVDSGRRPVAIGLLMALIDNSVTGHPFRGWHQVVVRAGVTLSGVRGFWIMDPNFSPKGGIRPDPKSGKRFYSDAVIQGAFVNNSPSWAIVPTYLMVMPQPTPQPAADEVKYHRRMESIGWPNIRATPGGRYLGQAEPGDTLVSRTLRKKSAKYENPWNGLIRTDWLSVEYRGQLAWTAKAFWKTERIL